VSYSSPVYYKMKRLADLVDPDLLDKYNRGSRGVWVAQTPALSVIDWGRYAFDSDAVVGSKFFEMTTGHTAWVATWEDNRVSSAAGRKEVVSWTLGPGNTSAKGRGYS